MTILGIDPGSSRMGFCLLKKTKGMQLVHYGVIEIKNSKSSEKIYLLAKKLTSLLMKYKPDCAALEKLYFAKNKKTAMEVAEAIGVIKYILKSHKIPFKEFSPPEIKSAVTGYGSADKKGVSKMVKSILRLDEIKGPDDITDAMAVAITAYYSRDIAK